SICLHNTPPPTHLYTLSLHDALPICLLGQIHLMRGEYAEAKRCAEESLEIAEAISNLGTLPAAAAVALLAGLALGETVAAERQADRKSTRLNSSHDQISYAVFCLKKK